MSVLWINQSKTPSLACFAYYLRFDLYLVNQGTITVILFQNRAGVGEGADIVNGDVNPHSPDC